MKNRDGTNVFILTILFLYIIIHRTMISQKLSNFSEIITACFLILLASIVFLLIGFRKDKKTVLKTIVLKNTMFYIITTFVIIYGLGLFVGFLKNAYSLKLLKIFDNILGPICIVITSELIRYLIISANKDKKYTIVLITILLILLDLSLSLKINWYQTPKLFFDNITSIILPISLKHCLLSYLCYETGIRSPLAYRLVLDLTCYLLPIFPNLGNYLNSMILLSLPIIIYMKTSNIIWEYKNGVEHDFDTRKFRIYDIPIVIIMTVFVILISGYFKYFLIGIGSNSMQPKINKGDAVIVEKIESQKDLKKGDIIAYKKDDITVIHRLIKIEKENGKTYYITKGDANPTLDNIKIQQNDIEGIVKMRIPVIAYPSVFLSELLS